MILARGAQSRITTRGVYARGRPQSSENRVSFWRHPIDFISVTSLVCTDQRQDSRSPISRVLRAVHRSGAPPTRRYRSGPEASPLSNSRMIFAQCDVVAGNSTVTESGKNEFHGSDGHLPRARRFIASESRRE